MVHYELVVIGAGPAGYVAAIRAAQNGLKVALIEKNAVGGTCLNVGCIPSKSYIKHAHWVLSAQEASQHGIDFKTNGIDFSRLVARKDKVVTQLQSGIRHLMDKYGIKLYEGLAEVDANQSIRVGTENLGYDHLILATGSRPFVPPIEGLDQVDYDTTDTFFTRTELPKQLAIIGGGIIAIELAFAMKPLGVEVTVIEVAKDILLTEDEDARQLIKKRLAKMGIRIIVDIGIEAVQEGEVVLSTQEAIAYDQLLIATGRRADLSLANQLGLTLDETGRFVKVDHHYRTNVANIYAVGDQINTYMLAHLASEEGLHAVAAILKEPKPFIQADRVPRCLYTEPEIGSFGLSAQEAREKGYEVVEKTLPFSANGKAISAIETDGFVKIISERQYQQILGVVIVGAHATEMIHTALAMKQAEGTMNELADMVFAHPTLSEVMGEAAKSSLFKAIHE